MRRLLPLIVAALAILLPAVSAGEGTLAGVDDRVLASQYGFKVGLSYEIEMKARPLGKYINYLKPEYQKKILGNGTYPEELFPEIKSEYFTPSNLRQIRDTHPEVFAKITNGLSPKDVNAWLEERTLTLYSAHANNKPESKPATTGEQANRSKLITLGEFKQPGPKTNALGIDMSGFKQSSSGLLVPSAGIISGDNNKTATQSRLQERLKANWEALDDATAKSVIEFDRLPSDTKGVLALRAYFLPNQEMLKTDAPAWMRRTGTPHTDGGAIEIEYKGYLPNKHEFETGLKQIAYDLGIEWQLERPDQRVLNNDFSLHLNMSVPDCDKDLLRRYLENYNDLILVRLLTNKKKEMDPFGVQHKSVSTYVTNIKIRGLLRLSDIDKGWFEIREQTRSPMETVDELLRHLSKKEDGIKEVQQEIASSLDIATLRRFWSERPDDFDTFLERGGSLISANKRLMDELISEAKAGGGHWVQALKVINKTMIKDPALAKIFLERVANGATKKADPAVIDFICLNSAELAADRSLDYRLVTAFANAVLDVRRVDVDKVLKPFQGRIVEMLKDKDVVTRASGVAIGNRLGFVKLAPNVDLLTQALSSKEINQAERESFVKALVTAEKLPLSAQNELHKCLRGLSDKELKYQVAKALIVNNYPDNGLETEIAEILKEQGSLPDIVAFAMKRKTPSVMNVALTLLETRPQSDVEQQVGHAAVVDLVEAALNSHDNSTRSLALDVLQRPLGPYSKMPAEYKKLAPMIAELGTEQDYRLRTRARGLVGWFYGGAEDELSKVYLAKLRSTSASVESRLYAADRYMYVQSTKSSGAINGELDKLIADAIAAYNYRTSPGERNTIIKALAEVTSRLKRSNPSLTAFVVKLLKSKDRKQQQEALEIARQYMFYDGKLWSAVNNRYLGRLDSSLLGEARQVWRKQDLMKRQSKGGIKRRVNACISKILSFLGE